MNTLTTTQAQFLCVRFTETIAKDQRKAILFAAPLMQASYHSELDVEVEAIYNEQIKPVLKTLNKVASLRRYLTLAALPKLAARCNELLENNPLSLVRKIETEERFSCL